MRLNDHYPHGKKFPGSFVLGYHEYSKPDMIDLFRNDDCKIVNALHSEKFRPGFVSTISKMTKYQYNDMETKKRTKENANS